MAKKIQQAATTSRLMVAKHLGLPYTLLPNSTVNERLEIEQNAELNDGEYPNICCVVFGIKGHVTENSSAMGTTSPKSRRHRPRDTALREHIPAAMRLLNDDFNEVERKRYGLREIVEHEGETHVIYWAYRIDLTSVNIEDVILRMRDGELESEDSFSYSSSDLRPSIPEINVDLNDALTDGDAIRSAALTKIVLNAADLTEIINVFKILYGDDDLALISEWGYCTGVDRIVQVPGANGENIAFNEIIGCQVSTFVSQFTKIESNEDIIDLSMDFGSRATRLTISE